MRQLQYGKTLSLILFFSFFASFTFAQTIIRGVVRDAKSGDPLPFVGVAIKGTTTGTTTDVQGHYELQTSENVTKIQFSFLGYQTLIKDFVVGQTQTMDANLKEDNRTLDEVVIKPKKEKYRNKDNPAVELIRQVIAHKKQNRMEHYDYVSYQEYEKMQMAINNTPESIKKNVLFKKYQFVLDNVDTTRFVGKALLPLYLEENITQKYFQKNPEKRKNIITATKRINFDDRFINNESISKYMKHLYQDVDLYENNVYLITNSFLSPIADMSPTFYKFYITDTVADNGIKLVELSFVPRNRNDFLFIGKMYVTLDGNYGVQKAELGVSKDINLNWVTSLDVTLDFERSEDGRFHPSKTNMLVNFGVFQGKKGIFGERTITIRNFNMSQPIADSIFKGQQDVRADSSLNHNDQFWAQNRPDSLTQVEANTYKNMDSLSNMKSFKRLLSWGTLALAGYKVVGPTEIGPVSTFYSFNPVEGFRLRFGGRTTTDFSKRFYTEAYVAYGFKDERFKFFLSGTYSINNKSIYTYPLNYFRASFQRETSIPGQDLQFMQEDNLLLSFKRGVNDKWMYNDIFRMEYVYEFGDHMGFRLQYKNWKQEAAGGLNFIHSDAVYSDTSNAGMFAKYNPGKIKPVLDPDTDRILPWAFMTPPDEYAFTRMINMVLQDMQLDGTIEKIVRKHQAPTMYFPGASIYKVDGFTQN